MAPYYSAICARYLRFAAILCLGFGGLCGSGTANATTRVELYQATVPLTDRSDAAQAGAFQAAMRTVLIRVTGRRNAGEDAAFAPLFNNARRYVQQYRGAPDNRLWVAFDGSAIERWLTQNGQPLWGRERPTTVVWLGVQSGAQSGSVITADSTSDLKSAVDDAAALRGVPLLWPSAADVERNHVDFAALSSMPGSALADAAKRLGGDGTLIGRATNGTATASIRWTHVFQDRSQEFSGAADGVNRVADMYAGLFAASGTLMPIDIEVSGVGELRDYAAVQSYLESLTFVSHVSVLDLSADTVRFRLTSRGGAESLQRALSLSGRLQPVAAGDNGLQRFKVRR